jgi:hypothetical protein
MGRDGAESLLGNVATQLEQFPDLAMGVDDHVSGEVCDLSSSMTAFRMSGSGSGL